MWIGKFWDAFWSGLGRERPPVVAVVRLAGIIGRVGPMRGGLTLAGLEDALEQAFRLRRLRAVALAVNSPGGAPVQSALIHKRIRALAAEHEVPVVTFVEDVAASGGYWLACAGDEIFVDDTSILGSIGVITAGFGFTELLQRIGVERRVHTAGDRKSMLDPFRPEDPEEVARLEAIQQEMHETFKTLVRERRGDKVTGDEDDLFSGEFWSGPHAVELGLADAVGEMRAVMRERYGDKVKLQRIEPRRGLMQRLRFGAARPPEEIVAALLAAVEDRALWSRYGL